LTRVGCIYNLEIHIVMPLSIYPKHSFGGSVIVSLTGVVDMVSIELGIEMDG